MLVLILAVIFGGVNVGLAVAAGNVSAALGWGLATLWMVDGLRRSTR